jgi:hypothetical protein
VTPPTLRILARLVPVLVLALAPALAQDKPGRPDQVFVRNARTATVSMVSGSVTANELARVALTAAGKETTYKAELVERIEWGDVPPSYRDGREYFARGQWSDAAAAFRIAAGDAGGRDIVRAHARLRAAEALLRWGAAEPVHFGEAAQEAARFLSDYPTNRDVPRARMVEARATWLAGNPKDAAAKYRTVYDEWKAGSPTEGYDALVCMRAGLEGARASLAAGDTLAARELYTALDGALGALLPTVEPTHSARHDLEDLRQEAVLGEGWCELAAKNHRAALTFFQSKLSAAQQEKSDTLRYGAMLGLGEALLADIKAREAQLHLARVAALDHTDRDRSARALVRLAESALLLGDAESRVQAKTWLEVVLARYGDTPWAAPARQLMEKVR